MLEIGPLLFQKFLRREQDVMMYIYFLIFNGVIPPWQSTVYYNSGPLRYPNSCCSTKSSTQRWGTRPRFEPGTYLPDTPHPIISLIKGLIIFTVSELLNSVSASRVGYDNFYCTGLLTYCNIPRAGFFFMTCSASRVGYDNFHWKGVLM